jgi:23S rRNA (guanosine2251-2'-O)-methyltransferase
MSKAQRHRRTSETRSGREDRRRHGRRGDGEDLVQLWGLHTAEAAIANAGRTILTAAATENALHRLGDGLAARGIAPERVLPRDLDRRIGADSVHQGILLTARPLPEPTLAELARSRQDAAPVLIVVLDQVTDPHNVGAILRSAAAFGAAGLVMTRHNSPALSGALAKAASGALDIVPIALETNLARALAELRELGVHCLGLDGDGEHQLEASRLDKPTALVLGSEGRGLRRLTRENCDELCRIGTRGGLASLNVSNAAAVALHWLSHSR